jgi:hypothetical protein
MDEKTKSLLGTATVAVASLGIVSLPGEAAPPDQRATLIGSQTPSSLNPRSDLLVELMLRTGGSHSVEAIDRELRLMLSYISPERLVQIPALIKGIRSLGFSEDAEELILATLIDVIADASLPIDELQIEQLAEALVSEPERALLAKPAQSEQGSTPNQLSGRGIGLYEG